MNLEIKKIRELSATGAMCLIYGYSGCGKTHSVSTLPHGETLIINSDRGTRTLDSIAPEIDVCHVATIEESYCIPAILEPYRYVVFDSLTAFGELLLIQFKSGKTKDGNKMHGQAAYGRMGDSVMKMLYHFSTMPHIFIILAQDQRVNFEDAGIFDYCYCPEIPGKSYARGLPFRFDFVWPIRTKLIEDGSGNEIQSRRFQTNMTGDGQYLAKTRGNELDLYEEVNLTNVFKKLGL